MIKKSFLLFNLILILNVAAYPQQDTIKKTIDELFTRFNQEISPGACVGVLHDRSVRYQSCYGKSSIEEKTPVTPDTRYHLGDLSYQFTAAAIMKLKEQEKLSYNEKVSEILPEDFPYGDNITIEMLLQQTSGLPAYKANTDTIEEVQPNFFQKIFGYRENYLDNQDLLNYVASQPELQFQPGKTWRHANTNYALLAEIIERKSGKSYKAYIEEELFLPAGLENAVVPEKKRFRLDQYAPGYIATRDSFLLHDENRKNKVYGSSGIYMSLSDYLKWIQALNSGSIISKNTLNQAERIKFFRDVIRFYGYAWTIEFNKGQKYLYHGNNQFGYTHLILHIPAEDIYVLILSNHGAFFGIRGTAFKMANLYTDKKYEAR